MICEGVLMRSGLWRIACWSFGVALVSSAILAILHYVFDIPFPAQKPHWSIQGVGITAILAFVLAVWCVFHASIDDADGASDFPK